MNEQRITEASSMIGEAILGDRLLTLFRGVTGGRTLSASVMGALRLDSGNREEFNTKVGILSGRVRLPGFEVLDIPVALSGSGLAARLVIGDETNPVIAVETGAFDSDGNQIREFDDSPVVEFAHLVAVNHSQKNWQPWDQRAMLYDRMLAAVKGYARKDLGVKAAEKYMFYVD